MTKTLFRKFGAFLAIAAILLAGSMSLSAADAHKSDKPETHETHAAGDADHDQGHGHGKKSEKASWLKKAAYSYLTAYMFFLSVGLGSLFLILIHHLFDAQWLVPIRRYLETVASLLGVPMGLLFIPILLLQKLIYPWLTVADPEHDHALYAKIGMLNQPWFIGVSVFLFFFWWYLTGRLRYWSTQQDIAEVENGGFEGKLGWIERRLIWLTSTSLFGRKVMGHRIEDRPSVLCSRMMNIHASYGILAFALTLTLAAIYWMKSIQYQWFSTMYGVYYFAGSVWVSLAVAYYMQLRLKEMGPLEHVVTRATTHDTGKLFFAFTVFYAYIHFSQYFLIWNAAIPEETFWYVQREQGTWWAIGQIIIFGHFFIPFILLLPIWTKVHPVTKYALVIWALLMHYFDMNFNIMPNVYPKNFFFGHWDVLSLGIIGAALWWQFHARFREFAPYPQRDPRIAETMGVYVEPEGGEQAV